MVALIEKPQNPRTLMEAMRHFTPDVAERYIESVRWPGGVCCPKCGSVNVGRIVTRRRFQCRENGCRKQFSVMTGTILEDSHLTLDRWVIAVWMLCACRNGISSHEIKRTLGCCQLTGWHLLHRIRLVMKDENRELGSMHGAEADWTYVGGVLKFMRMERQNKVRKMRDWGKSVVHAIKDRRTGNVRARVLPSAKLRWLRAEIRRNVEPDTPFYTDGAKAYVWARDEYRHEAVNHMALQYVKGECHVNGCENFFNCLRRGLKGTYVRATAEHLQPYVDEQVWRFNHRKDSEWERFEAAMRAIVGKRLTYSGLTGGAKR